MCQILEVVGGIMLLRRGVAAWACAAGMGMLLVVSRVRTVTSRPDVWKRAWRRAGRRGAVGVWVSHELETISMF
jgi:hypothetical protein